MCSNRVSRMQRWIGQECDWAPGNMGKEELIDQFTEMKPEPLSNLCWPVRHFHFLLAPFPLPPSYSLIPLTL